MKKITLVIAALGVALATLAQPVSPTVTSDRMKPVYNQEKMQLLKGNVMLPVNKIPQARADEPTYNVTFKCSWEQGVHYPSSVVVLNENLTRNLSMNYGQLSEVTTQLPAGTYECFAQLMDNTFSKMLIDFKEQVEINSDTTIEFSTSNITHRIKFRPVNPQGEVWTPNEINYEADENGNYQPVVTKPGNCETIGLQANIILKGYGNVTGKYVSADGVFQGQDFWAKNDLYISDLSDRYAITNSVLALTGDEVYISKMVLPNGTSNDTLSNDPTDYIPYSETFKVVENEDFTDTNYGGYLIYDYYNGMSLSGWVGETVGIPTELGHSAKFFIDAPASDPTDDVRYDIVVAPTAFNHEENVATGMRYALPIIANPIVMKDGEPYYVHVNIDSYASETNFASTDDLPTLDKFPGLDALTYTVAEKTDIFGNSTPINVFYMKNYETEPNYFDWSMGYFGRMGELRREDWKYVQMDMTYNGQPVTFADYGEFQLFSASQLYPGTLPIGPIDFTATTAIGTVDDMPSMNVTHVMSDMNNPDYIFPTLRALQFRNSEGQVTDRFNTADEGKMMFTAVDYAFPINVEQGTFATLLQPVNAQVEYAPMGSEEWIPLEINRNDEWSSTNFGYFYEATLAQVTEHSPNGWFDLKVTLTDEAGNLQEQTISPAFKINTMSGIGQVKSGERVPVAYYTVDGICHNVAQQGVNIVRYSDGSTSKVIVR